MGSFQTYELHDPEIGRSQTTIENYEVLFASHIIPRWGSTPLDEVEAVKVELEFYAQGEEEAKRAAQEHVSELFFVQKIAS